MVICGRRSQSGGARGGESHSVTSWGGREQVAGQHWARPNCEQCLKENLPAAVCMTGRLSQTTSCSRPRTTKTYSDKKFNTGAQWLRVEGKRPHPLTPISSPVTGLPPSPLSHHFLPLSTSPPPSHHISPHHPFPCQPPLLFPTSPPPCLTLFLVPLSLPFPS